MLNDYLKTAWRSLTKNKTFSLINIAGLSLGTVACLFILQYVSFELSFDRFNKNAKDIYRIANDRYQNGRLIQHGVITYSAIGTAMRNEYPDIINHTRVKPFTQQVVINNDSRIGDLTALAVDNAFLTMFSYPFVAGDATNGLREPNTVILTAALAEKLFHIKNDFQSLIGRSIVISTNAVPWKITAICENVAPNSHLQFDLLVSYRSLYEGGNGTMEQADYGFTNSDFWHYIQLKPDADYKTLQSKFGAFSDKYFQGTKVSGSIEKFSLQPLTKIHLYSDYEYEIAITGSAVAVWGLLIVAAFIITIAWINYINLSTAKSLERAKEVGIRKVAGASRAQLVKQFLTEAIILNILATGIAIYAVQLLQRPFNELVQHKLSLSTLFNNGTFGSALWIIAAIFLLLGIFGSTFYPAFVISAFKPLVVLKGRFTSTTKGALLRKVLVVGQFAVTVMLIICSLVVYRQIRYVNEQKLGIDIDRILVVKPPLLTGFDSTFIDRANNFKNELNQLPHVKGATTIGRTPGDELSRIFNVHRADLQTGNNAAMRVVSIDGDFMNVYDVTLMAGRNFVNTDYHPQYERLHSLIINELAVKQLGFASNEEAIGKKVTYGGAEKNWDIIGVMKDFHQKSLHYRVEPTVFLPVYDIDNPICVKIDMKDLAGTIRTMKSKFEKFFPGNFFDYYFLDEKFNRQYSDDRLFGKVFGIFAGFAIFIACLGLLGLSLFATLQRTKEIGVRKVLGASVSQIVVLLSKDFIRLVLIAFVIASPIAWYLMHSWLNDFAYRINIGVWIFLASGIVAIVIAVATISLQSVRAALANPIKSLRTE